MNRRRRRWKALAPLGVTCVALALAGCFGSDDGDETPTLPPGTARTAAATDTATTGAETATASPTGTATATPTETEVRDPGAETTAAIEAASGVFGGEHLDNLDREACEAADPPSRICISLQSDPATVAAGVARFTAGDLDGGGFLFFMGRRGDGSWGYWFGTQQADEVPEPLPGPLLACGADGPVVIREGPSMDSVEMGNAERGDELMAEEFVLTADGAFSAGGAVGDGWYRISAPAKGWVTSSEVTDAALGDCLLHDERRGNSG